MRRAALLLALLATQARADVRDPVAVQRTRCLDDPGHASTAGQVDCEVAAQRSYERRLNTAYARLTSMLPVGARERLRAAQRVWLRLRDAEAAARGAVYATRQGTVYVPMQAADETDFTRDRTLQLEAYLRVMRIDR